MKMTINEKNNALDNVLNLKVNENGTIEITLLNENLNWKCKNVILSLAKHNITLLPACNVAVMLWKEENEEYFVFGTYDNKSICFGVDENVYAMEYDKLGDMFHNIRGLATKVEKVVIPEKKLNVSVDNNMLKVEYNGEYSWEDEDIQKELLDLNINYKGISNRPLLKKDGELYKGDISTSLNKNHSTIVFDLSTPCTNEVKNLLDMYSDLLGLSTSSKNNSKEDTLKKDIEKVFNSSVDKVKSASTHIKDNLREKKDRIYEEDVIRRMRENANKGVDIFEGIESEDVLDGILSFRRDNAEKRKVAAEEKARRYEEERRRLSENHKNMDEDLEVLQFLLPAILGFPLVRK